MRWDNQRQSDNVEDRRGSSLPRAAGGLSIGGLIMVGLVSWFLGVDPRVILQGAEQLGLQGAQPQQQESRSGPITDPNDRVGRFVSSILATTEDTWDQIFKEAGRTYTPPRLVLFSGRTLSACGNAEAAMGPFYCPMDRKVYLDTTFFTELSSRFHSPGEFAAAYVVGHEVGHHVQNLMGILPRVQEAQRSLGQVQQNALQVRVELQADCFAGVWAAKTNSRIAFLEDGDIDQALRAASAIGDDTLQRRSQGTVVPESFTHGSSQQRMRWFMTGIRSNGRLEACNTFEARSL
jgi:uncharacterized protein